MKIPYPPQIAPTNEMLQLISRIDAFKGGWDAGNAPPPEQLQSLRRFATIESVGSSTRIEGSKLSDAEVETLLGDLETESFRSRDEEEVGGYAVVMEMLHDSWEKMELSENLLLQLHRDLLQFSTKDERHRGSWKTLPNHVSAFDADGKEIGVVFQTASPFETPELIRELVEWHQRELSAPYYHPLLRVAVIVVVFLAIHPFQDGNGRLSRVLTNLLLMQAGYSHVAYGSLESVVEHNKDSYYRALRKTQKSLPSDDGGDPYSIDWNPWVHFFLRSLRKQIDELEKRIDTIVREESIVPYGATPRTTDTIELSPLAEKVLKELQQHKTLTVAETVEALGANRNTVKVKFRELIAAGLVRLCGKGRGAHYREA